MKQNGGGIEGLDIKSPDTLSSLKPDVILLGTLMGLEEVPKQIIQLGVSIEKLEHTERNVPFVSNLAYVWF